MAARENQGLQIALIIFVMITIMLIVSTYLLFQNNREAQDKIKAITTENQNKDKAAGDANRESEQYKAIIGAATTDKLEGIQEATNKDLEKYGKSVPEGKRHYRYLVESLGTALAGANTRITEITAHEKELTDKIKTDETAKAAEIDEYKKKLADAANDLEAERKKFNQTLKELESTKAELAKRFEDKRRDHDELTKRTSEEIGTLANKNTKLETVLKIKNDESLRQQKANEIADGKINWVNQRTRSVWINLGSADGLRQQTLFSVFPGDELNPLESTRKGKIQVTRVIDRHLAEARILEDNLSKPLMPGDQVFSPSYEAGRPEHFALAGIIDIDGDGRSDHQQIHDLIATNGGIIDEEVGADGKKTGEMSIDTKYLVLGKEPKITGAGDKDTKLRSYIDIRGEASVLGVKTISVNEFLDYMGYKVQDRTVNLGRKANPIDFTPRFPDGIQRKSPDTRPQQYRTRIPARE
jgi:hypothetical protein